MAQQSDKRFLLISALVFGLVATAASARWLNTGEIVIRQGTRQQVQAASEGPRAS